MFGILTLFRLCTFTLLWLVLISFLLLTYRKSLPPFLNQDLLLGLARFDGLVERGFHQLWLPFAFVLGGTYHSRYCGRFQLRGYAPEPVCELVSILLEVLYQLIPNPRFWLIFLNTDGNHVSIELETLLRYFIVGKSEAHLFGQLVLDLSFEVSESRIIFLQLKVQRLHDYL